MLESVVVALITGGLSLVGVIITVFASSHKTNENLRISQAVTDTKISELTREVREHNNFAQRIPVMEEQIKNIDTRISVLESSTIQRKV